MTQNEALTQEASNGRYEIDPDDDKFEEEWTAVINTGGKYTLSKIQARILQQAIATGNRGVVMFRTFSISIPYLAEFYREKRFLKDAKQLPARATEPEYKPMNPSKFAEWKKKCYAAIGRPINEME